MKAFANLHMHTDAHAFEVVRVVSEKTIEIRRMISIPDPSWKPQIIPGGFAGHCVNQNEQKWFYSSDESAPVIRARLRKDGQFHSKYGRHVLNDRPVEFHDYNY